MISQHQDTLELAATAADLTVTEALYLDLLKKCLTRSFMPEKFRRISGASPFRSMLHNSVARLLASCGLELVRVVSTWDPEVRSEGRDFPTEAETMIGMKRLDNLQTCVLSVLSDGVPGDFIETGAWRGGSMHPHARSPQDQARDDSDCLGGRFIQGIAAASPDSLPTRRRRPALASGGAGGAAGGGQSQFRQLWHAG